MPTAFEDLYAAAKTMMGAAATAASATLTQAPTNYGDDFRITPDESRYQVQIVPQKPWLNSNVSYPRAIVTVFVHHYASDLTSEEAFLHVEMSAVADQLLSRTQWREQDGIYDLQPDIDPEMDDGGRVGKVISFEISASVLMDAA